MLFYLAALAILPGLAYAYANPEPCSGLCVISDPGLMRRVSDGKYFRFSTGGGITYATSDSLNGPWEGVGSVVPGGSKINMAGNTDLWVSCGILTIHYATDRLPLLTLCVNKGTRCSLHRTNLLRFLCCLHLRHPVLCHRPRHISHHGAQHLDRSRIDRRFFSQWQALQCH